VSGDEPRPGTAAREEGSSPRRSAESSRPFPSGRGRAQADGDPDGDSEFAGNRSAPAEDVAQSEAPDDDGWTGDEDNVGKRAPGRAAPKVSDRRHHGVRGT
jgi:hypothetical protein